MNSGDESLPTQNHIAGHLGMDDVTRYGVDIFDPPSKERMQIAPHEDDRLDEALLDELFEDTDPRIQSGVADDADGDDLDFIRMSGLTSPAAGQPVRQGPFFKQMERGHKLAPPVSFYEPGVADVDAAMSPQAESIAPIRPDTSNATLPVDDVFDVDAQEDHQEYANPIPNAAVDEGDESSLAEIDALIEVESDPDQQEISESEPAPETSFPERETEAAADAFDFIEPQSNETPPAVPDRPLDAAAFDYPPPNIPQREQSTQHPADAIDFCPIPPEEAETAEALHVVALPETAPAVRDAILTNASKRSGWNPSFIETEWEPSSEPEPVVQDDHVRRRSHHRGLYSSPRLRFAQAGKLAILLLVAVVMVSVLGYQGFRWARIQFSNPTMLFYQAEALASEGKHLQASRLYQEFTRWHPKNALAPDAQFLAGYEMQLLDLGDSENARRYNEEAAAMLAEFIKQYPEHERAGRAQSLIGILQYRLGDYRAAVDTFISQDAILRDPAATLPMLRTLARSYAQLGEYDAAHSTYVRAANTPGNTSPEIDYEELGAMYESAADSTNDIEERRQMRELAIEQWTHAMRAPGINPTRKNAIRVKLDVLAELSGVEQRNQVTNDAGASIASDIVVPLPQQETDSPDQPFSMDTMMPVRLGDPIVEDIPNNDADPAAPQETQFELIESSGQELEAEIESIEPPLTHEVTAGDTLLRISINYDLPLPDLMQWNGIEDSNHIEIGQHLALTKPATAAVE